MKQQIVSVRMPKTLVDELRASAKKNHFMDLSEELRFILKTKHQEHQDPYTYELRRFKEELKEELVSKRKEDQTKFLQDLKKILEEIKDE
ncbi:hypothetical protein GOV05_01530 [Candidatus Woesearchaeota archaeon]|nr:hypothetical protein [Candidatus Woesearchaeota archaeon]